MNMEEDGFNNLPLELIFKIFSYLDLHTLRCTIPRVCKTFRDIVKQPALWNSCYVSVYVESQSCPKWSLIPEFLKSTPVQRLQLKRFNCQNYSNLDDSSNFSKNVQFEEKIIARLVFKSSLHLKELSFVGFKNLSIGKFSNISSSSLRKLEITAIEPKTLCDILSSFPLLTELRIISFKGNLTEDLINQMKGIKTLHLPLNNCEIPLLLHLKTLGLLRFSASDSEPNLPKLLAIKDLPLHQLELREKFMAPYFPRSALSAFFSSRNFSQLRYVLLEYCRFCDKSALFLTKNCQNLLTLEVENAPKDDDEFLTESGVKTLLHMQYLRLLKISVMMKESNDLFYKRFRWIPHHCDNLECCSAPIDDLLQGWQEIEINVST